MHDIVLHDINQIHWTPDGFNYKSTLCEYEPWKQYRGNISQLTGLARYVCSVIHFIYLYSRYELFLSQHLSLFPSLLPVSLIRIHSWKYDSKRQAGGINQIDVANTIVIAICSIVFALHGWSDFPEPCVRNVIAFDVPSLNSCQYILAGRPLDGKRTSCLVKSIPM